MKERHTFFLLIGEFGFVNISCMKKKKNDKFFVTDK